MEEMNNENLQYKHDEIDRPMGYGKNYPYDFDWKKQCPYGKCKYMPNWQHSYGPNWPNMYGPYLPGGFYGGGYGLPWLLLALKSMSPRDILRYIDEIDGMNL